MMQLFLVYRKPRELRVVAMVDSNYATNKDDRRSVSGAIYTIGGTTTNWMSKTQSSTTLSTTEAEYFAISMATQEIRFTQMLLEEIAECVYPGVILEDNTGAIFLVKNRQVGQRTKHIDVRHHYVREHCDAGRLAVKFVRSEENEADIFTKNVTEMAHDTHAFNLRSGRLGIWREWDKMVKPDEKSQQNSKAGLAEQPSEDETALEARREDVEVWQTVGPRTKRKSVLRSGRFKSNESDPKRRDSS